MHKSKEMLKGIYRAECLIERKREQVRRLENLAEHSGIRYGDEPRGTGGAIDSKAEIVCRIVELKEEIEGQLDFLIDAKLEAMRLIDSLDNGDEADVLYMRYLEYRKWEDIAKEKGYSPDWVFKTHRKALEKIEEFCK